MRQRAMRHYAMLLLSAHFDSFADISMPRRRHAARRRRHADAAAAFILRTLRRQLR